MQTDKLKLLLEQVQAGKLDVDSAFAELRNLPYENLGDFATLDHHHGRLARIEVALDEIERLASLRQKVSNYFKSLGFHYVVADLTGYRLGSLNEVLK